MIYSEGVLVGYRYYSTKHIAPLFPFGHGLSYSSFIYTGISFSPLPSAPAILSQDSALNLSLDITNTGKILAHETIQLYIEPPASSKVFRPKLELQGFQKIKDIKPGETRNVRFGVDQYAVSYYDETRNQWIAEKGVYKVHIGASVEDLKAEITFEIVDEWSWTGL